MVGPSPLDGTVPEGAPDGTPRGAGPGGERIAHYQLIRELGRGGQAVVYEATDTLLGRRVALKLLIHMAGLSDPAVRRFRREAEAASRLEHPGICQVFELGQAASTWYIAMQLIPGEPLSRRLQVTRVVHTAGPSAAKTVVLQLDGEPGRPPPPSPPSGPAPSSPLLHAGRRGVMEVVTLIEQAARALHSAHEAGVIHRDIKPSNLMVTPEGRLVILDFGLAWMEEDQGPALTRSGDFMGTPAYMSPEQIAAYRIRLDRRTDVYSLGATLYECLTLRPPFESPTREGLYQAILTKDPVDPRQLNPGVNSDLRTVLETALEKDRDRRYQTALDLAEDLRRVRELEPILAKPIGRVARLWRWCQRRPAQALAVLLALLLFVSLSVGTVVLLQALGETRQAQADAEAALQEARVARAAAQRRLDDFERLADAKRLEQLGLWSEELWPATPDRVEALTEWLDEAEALAARLPTHEATLARLREQALPWSEAEQAEDARTHPRAPELSRLRVRRVELERALGSEAASEELREALALVTTEIAELEPRIQARRTWRFERTEDAFMHDALRELVQGLEAFTGEEPVPGTIAEVRLRLAFARTIEERTVTGVRARQLWADAIEDIAEHPAYGGLTIVPQLGLLPLGKDPSSGLWEFAHLATGAPAVRDEQGQLHVTEESGVVLILLPGGTFWMGAQAQDATLPNFDQLAETDEDVHQVTLSPFLMSKYELTQAQWQRHARANPSLYGAGTEPGGVEVLPINPVESVNCPMSRRLATQVGLRLPSEAEWEYACRAGTDTPWWCGAEEASLEGAGNLCDSTLHETGWQGPCLPWSDGFPVHAPVGLFAANAFGLHDVHGNVNEWCEDSYGSYAEAPRDGSPALEAGAPFGVYRGGCWNTAARSCRSALRVGHDPGFRDHSIGLRPACSLRGVGGG